MLTYPDRRRFEQIRARWESVLAAEDGAAAMVSRKVKQPFSQPPYDDSNSGSRFRRKFSHGLAFISNPLLQRRVTPGRTQADEAAQAITKPVNKGITSDNFHLSRSLIASSIGVSDSTASEQAKLSPNDVEARDNSISSPPVLQRSRTLTSIPRPMGSALGSLSTDVQETTRNSTPASMCHVTKPTGPSKIPTPSPPLNEWPLLTPRQYRPPNKLRNTENSKPMRTLVAKETCAPRQHVLRSRTTPNLVKDTTSLHGMQNHGLISYTPLWTVGKSTFQENIPIKARVVQTSSHIHDNTGKQESFTTSGVMGDKAIHWSQNSALVGEHSTLMTPLKTLRMTNTRLTQHNPMTAKRVQPNDCSIFDASKPPPNADDCPATLLPPSEYTREIKSSSTIADTTPLIPAHSNVKKDRQKTTLGTPNSLANMWRTSPSFAITSYEVRETPPAHTFYQFGTQKSVMPPVPSFPELYLAPSLPDFHQGSAMISNKPTPSKEVSDHSSCQSLLENRCVHGVERDTTHSSPTAPDDPTFLIHLDFFTTHHPLSKDLPTSRHSCVSEMQLVISNDHDHQEHANIEPYLQVKDYMPMLYWAGRFQSRFDQWRTEAMNAELGSDEYQTTSRMDAFKLEQEDRAACYIFDQLRDLCITDQAAASLSVSIYSFVRIV